MNIAEITSIEGVKNLAILDTSSISFLQNLQTKIVYAHNILRVYDLILIPNWVLIELSDAVGRVAYIESLIENGYPIKCIKEEAYCKLVNGEEINLFEIIWASSSKLAKLRGYLRRYVLKEDKLEIEEYKKWINKLYENWPLSEEIYLSKRIKKKNAGEVSITILSEIASWYYPNLKNITIYSQDRDTFEFQIESDKQLRRIFKNRINIPVAYKSNDGIIFQLARENRMEVNDIDKYRKDERRITYTKFNVDCSTSLIEEMVDNEKFKYLINDKNANLIF